MLTQSSSVFDANRLVSENAVRDLLQAMTLAVNENVPAVFFGLSCVSEFRTSPDLPPLPDYSVYPIFQVVTQLIEREYFELRNLHGLDKLSDAIDVHEAKAAIRMDLSVSSNVLMSWSLLYFVYVLVNLNISLEQYAEITGVVVRTARRYRTRGIRFLTAALVNVERDARRRARLRRLRLPLKYHPDVLIGRDRLIAQFQNSLENGQTKLIVTGESGVGKSAFVSFALNQYVSTRIPLPFDFILWLNDISTPDHVQDSIRQQVGSLPMAIGEWTILYRVAIVIDQSLAITAGSAIDIIFQNLSHATVILIADRKPTRLAPAAYFVVSPLNSDDTLHLAYSYLDNVVGATIENNIGDLYIQTQGIPLKVQRFVASHITLRENNFFERSQLDSERSSFIYALACILPAAPIAISELLSIFDGIITQADLMALVRAGYGQVNQIENTLILFGKPHEVGSENDLLNSRITELSLILASAATRYTSTVIALMRQIVQVGHSLLSREIAHIWLNALQDNIDQVATAEYGLDLYSHLLQIYGDDNAHMLVTYAHGLRKRGEWKTSLRILNDIISSSQAETREIEVLARLERSIVLRIPGDYDAAIADLHYIQYFGKQFGDQNLLDRIWVQWAQIALDTHDANLALSYLHKVEERKRQSSDFLLLQAEIFFELGQVQQTILICVTLLRDDQFRYGSEIAGRIFFLLGKCYLQQNDFNQSATMSRIACRYFEDNVRPLLVGRAMNNLAIALMNISSSDEAHILLERAHDIQKRIGDKTGLLITETNLASLNSNF